ncbi:MAG: heme ABC exporter ATP-binding protein CcmA [Terriglobia bacterium]
MPPAPPVAESVLELRNASKYFGDLGALRDVSLRVGPGEAVLLYGPNGAGKTTLLRMLASIARPSEGEVLFNGHDLHRDPAVAKAQIGFVSHATFLYGELTARENLRFTARLFGLKEVEKKIRSALSLFALEMRADEPVRGLSRGLQQRATLARALLHDPAFLLLDEPFTGLDATATENLQLLLRRLPEQGKALVFSTHNFEQGAALAERLVALEGGRLRFDGPLRMAPLDALRIQ